MTRRETLRVMRRWRSVIVAAALIGVVVGSITAPGTTAPTTFQATHTLLVDSALTAGFQVYRVPVLATRGAVPDRVAVRLGLERQLVRSKVSVESTEGIVKITGRSTDRAQAEALANVTAEELIVEFGGPKGPLHSLELAVASPVETHDVMTPNSRASRALMLGGFGLLFGTVAAFALERLDHRIRSKAGAEEALGAPVLTVVPALRRSERGRVLTAVGSTRFIESYRGLRTSVIQWSTQSSNGDSCPVIVITSPTGGEGATTTVAQLAATLGEIGRSVVAISADLRHPRLHLYFDRPREPGLTDVLRGAPDTRRLANLNLVTTLRGVRFVSSGAPVRNPAPLLEHIGDHLRDARSLGDFVLVDAPPLLTTSDGADLARHADGVLLVLRAGHTSVRAAARSAELLQGLGIPLFGAVLVGGDSQAGRT